MKKPHLKKGVLFIWLAIAVILLALYLLHRDWFDITQLRGLVDEHHFLVLGIYFLVLSCLGLTLIPSTPFAVAGVLLFPAWEAYLVNLAGILTSSTIVYYFARFLGLPRYFEAKYPRRIKKISAALQKKELPIIIAWSATPVVPTDLMIYVSSMLNVPIWKALLGVLIGEGALNAVYLFSADALV